MNKKSQGLSINIVVIAIIILFILFVLAVLFAGGVDNVVQRVQDVFNQEPEKPLFLTETIERYDVFDFCADSLNISRDSNIGSYPVGDEFHVNCCIPGIYMNNEGYWEQGTNCKGFLISQELVDKFA